MSLVQPGIESLEPLDTIGIVDQIINLQDQYINLIRNAENCELREFNTRTSELQAALGEISVPGIIHSVQFVFRGKLVEPLPEGYGAKSVDELELYTLNKFNYPQLRPQRLTRYERRQAYTLYDAQLFPQASQKNKLLLTHSRDNLATSTAIGTDPSNLPELIPSLRVIDTL